MARNLNHGRAEIDLRYVIAAAVLVAFAGLGLWHVHAGSWRPGPGGGPTLVPQLAFWAILPSAAVMLWAGLRRNRAARSEKIDLIPVLACVVWAAIYFWLVRKLGLVSASVLSLIVAMVILSPDRLRSLRIVVPVVLGCAVAFWFMFTRIAPVLQVRVWFF